jgi:hypothetical protein
MRKLRTPRSGWAKITLGVSLLFAVGVFVYFSLVNEPVNGAALAVLIIITGYWEYRRKLQDQITAERYEAEAKENRQQDRR